MTTSTVFDYSDNLFNGGQKITFYHEWSEKRVEFKAFDLSYSESVTNDWEEVVLPRRINRSYTWSGVIRSIQLGWNLPAFDITEAKNNLAKCSSMVKMMYPMTDETGQITGGNPVWHLGIMNFAHHEDSEAAGDDPTTMLAGFPTNFNFNIVPSDGFLYDDKGVYPYPKNLQITMGFTVILDDSKNFGWSSKGDWSGPSHFPWADDGAVFK
jgi:hypothetical protein